MRTAEQFMHDLLGEQQAFQRLKEQLESVTNADGFAIAVTKLDFIDSKIRYRLRPESNNWIIEDCNIRCRPCRGGGQTTDTQETCPKCNGTGWRGLAN